MIMIPTDRPVRSVERKRLTICLRIPPLSTHKGRRGSLGVLMAETGDGAQGIAKTSTPVRSPYPLLPQEKKGDFGLPDAPHEDCETRRRQKTLYLRAWHPVVILTAKARRTPPRSLAGVRSPTPAGARCRNAHMRPAAEQRIVHQQRRALHLHCPILRREVSPCTAAKMNDVNARQGWAAHERTGAFLTP
jgi:hypothetical protein